jgi:hypothetical protein
MVPSAVALVGVLALLLALELQVPIVEEPSPLGVHGASYPRYAARVRRFVRESGSCGRRARSSRSPARPDAREAPPHPALARSVQVCPASADF